MIIGITGKAQSGKDTACKIIQLKEIYDKLLSDDNEFLKEDFILRDLEYGGHIKGKWKKHAFADKLKECAAIILGENRRSFEDNFFKKQFTQLPLNNKEGEPMTNREFLQCFGTEVGRSIDKDLWVKSLINDYKKAINDSDNECNQVYWIIPDVRFPNEANAIKQAGGKIIKINREGSGAGSHISEQLIDQIPFDYEINNNGSMKEFIAAVTDVYEDIMSN